MLRIKKTLALLCLLLLAPGVPIGRWCNISDKDKMLFRMTINITYYTAIAALILTSTRRKGMICIVEESLINRGFARF